MVAQKRLMGRSPSSSSERIFEKLTLCSISITFILQLPITKFKKWWKEIKIHNQTDKNNLRWHFAEFHRESTIMSRKLSKTSQTKHWSLYFNFLSINFASVEQKTFMTKLTEITLKWYFAEFHRESIIYVQKTD